jgi:hypothetical protein
MDINGCQIVSVLNADAVDGFTPTVSRYTGCREFPRDDQIPKGSVKVSRGPFATIRDAIIYAHSWSDADTPPPMPITPVAEVPVTIETASETVAIQIEPASANPPIVSDEVK